MMCELGNRSPGVFLQAFEPLRMPESTRRIIDKTVQANKPATFAYDYFKITFIVAGYSFHLLMSSACSQIQLK